jgi:hypothetical protein
VLIGDGAGGTVVALIDLGRFKVFRYQFLVQPQLGKGLPSSEMGFGGGLCGLWMNFGMDAVSLAGDIGDRCVNGWLGGYAL